MSIKNTLTGLAVTFAAVGSAAGSVFLGAGTALAPHGPNLTNGAGSLSNTGGATAPGIYLDSGTQTTILRWPASSMGTAKVLSVGQPCFQTNESTATLVATHVIVSTSPHFYKCV